MDEAIANAIAGVKEKIESDDIPEEEFAIGVAEESGIEVPDIPADTDASVDSFIETITDDHVHGPDCEHSPTKVLVTQQTFWQLSAMEVGNQSSD